MKYGNKLRLCGGGGILLGRSVCCIYVAAHAYTARWRTERGPATLLPGNLEVPSGRIQPERFERADGMATFGVTPRAVYPAIRSRQAPYSSVADNPHRTADDLRGDLV